MNTYQVSGTATSSSRDPVQGADVTLARPDGTRIARTRTDPQGRYTLRSPDAGPHLVVCSRPGHPPHAAVVMLHATPSTLDLALVPTGTLAGTVRYGDQPAAGATVTVIDESAVVLGTAVATMDGRYAFRDVPVGSYTVTAHTRTAQVAASTVLVRAATSADHDIELSAATRLRGVVRDPDGVPVPEAIVTLLGSDGEPVAATATDAGGRYLFEDLPMSEYTLVAAVRRVTTDVVRVPQTAVLDPVITALRTGPVADDPDEPIAQTRRRRRALPVAVLGAVAVTAGGLTLGVSLVDRGGDSDPADPRVLVPESEAVIGAEPSRIQLPLPPAEPLVAAVPLAPAAPAAPAERFQRVSAATTRATPSAPAAITLTPTPAPAPTPGPPPSAAPTPLADPPPEPERPSLLRPVTGLIGGLLG